MKKSTTLCAPGEPYVSKKGKGKTVNIHLAVWPGTNNICIGMAQGKYKFRAVIKRTDSSYKHFDCAVN